MSFTNASPICFPTRAKDIALGTNPISFAAPAKNDDSFVLDMATSAVALGKVFYCVSNLDRTCNYSLTFALKVEINSRKGVPIPNNWGADKDGKPTTNPQDVLTDGGCR